MEYIISFWRQNILTAMEQYTLKNANNSLNTNIYSYLETSEADVIKLFTAVSYDSRVECLSLASFSSLV
jgi:hypothetical protein